jgi:hypothetical protein
VTLTVILFKPLTKRFISGLSLHLRAGTFQPRPSFPAKRQSGKNWIPGEAWNDKGDKIHVVMYSKAILWIFFSFGKDQPGFPFPPLIFLPQESLFAGSAENSGLKRDKDGF